MITWRKIGWLLAFLSFDLSGWAETQPVEWKAMPSLPDSIGVAAPFAGVSNDVLVVAGGANFSDGLLWDGGTKVWHDQIYLLDEPTGQWSLAGQLPRPLAYGVSVTYENSIICVGGSDQSRHYADAFRLEVRGQKIRIQELPPLPQPMANGAGAVLNGKLYVVAGSYGPEDTTASHGFWFLNLKRPEDGWRELPVWPGPARIHPVVAVQDGAFYLFSGIELLPTSEGVSRKHLRDGYRFDPTAGWTLTADLPRPAAAAPSPAAALGQSTIAIFGGDDGTIIDFKPLSEHPGFNRTLLAYHTITDTWRSLGDLPASRVTTSIVPWRGSWVIPSGEVSPGLRSPEIWAMVATGSQMQLGLLNTLGLFVYLGGIVWIGWVCSRTNKSTDDFFRGGQQIPWWAAGLSIFATMLSSITFMAIPANAYHSGWALFLANSYVLITPLVVFVFLPFYRRLNVTSAYEYLELRFNMATRLAASSLFILFQCGRIAIVLYLPALAIATVTNLNVSLCIVAMGVLCIAYTAGGGIKAVIWTDVVQAVFLVGSALYCLGFLFYRIEGGLSSALVTASDYGHLFEKVNWDWDVGIASGWVILIGSLFHHLFPLTASQDVVQRYITTKDEGGAARAIWLNSIVSVAATATFFLIGTALFAYFRQFPEKLDPHLSNDAIVPFFIVSALPAGLAGLVIAGILAAAQSTISSSINSIATVVVTDFQYRLQPRRLDGFYLSSARWVSVVVGLVGMGIAQLMATSDIRSLYTAFIEVIGLFGGALSGLFLLGVFSRHASARGAFAGTIISVGVLLYARSFHSLNAYAYAPIGVIVCVSVGWLVSFTAPERKNLSGLTVFTR
jgi:solute:Na+ symporter, SSS family